MPPVHYRPGAFPPRNSLDWTRLVPLIGPASEAVARYDGLLAAMPDPDKLLSLLSLQEAVISSRIDGGRATLGEVLEFESGQRVDASTLGRDIQSAVDCHLALRRAQQMLAELPLCLGVMRAAHRVLLNGTQRAEQAPGELRRGSVRVERAGGAITGGGYMPIDADELPDAVFRWERHIHEPVADRLVHLAVLYAEFEALHPFAEGNGRLARMLVPAFSLAAGDDSASSVHHQFVFRGPSRSVPRCPVADFPGWRLVTLVPIFSGSTAGTSRGKSGQGARDS